jgi:hypothetical protein
MAMDDRMLHDLGELARQEDQADQARFDERWDRLAAGTLTAEEEAELAALAASSPEGKEAYEAFRPLGADFQAQMVAKLSAELASAPPPEPSPVEPVETHSGVLVFRRVARRVEVWLGAAAAVAASWFVVVLTKPLPPLPYFSADPLIGNQTSRGSAPGTVGGTPVFSSGSPFPIVLRPQTSSSVHDRLETQVFLAPPGTGEAPWIAVPGFRLDRGTGGTVRLDGTVGETIQLPLGIWRICVVVSRPGKAPPARELPAALRKRHTDWQAACTEPFQTVPAQIGRPAAATGSGARVGP